MLTVCIGWDPHEIVAWNVLAHSIQRRASKPLRIIPIKLSQLKDVWARMRSPDQSTDFTYTRFLTPWLAQGGTSIFLDADMLVLCDIYELEEIALAQLRSDVLVVKHDYEPIPSDKFLGQKQTRYACKNWSSVMVFNGYRVPVKHLTPHYVNEASAMDLHQFKWASNVGDLPIEYNHLVGEYPHNPKAKIIHYTRGGPYFKGFENCEYSREWFAEYQDMISCSKYDHRKGNIV